MKVLFVTSELYPWKGGGPQKVVHDLAHALREKAELDILCVAPEDGTSPRDYYPEPIQFKLVRSRVPTVVKYPYRNLAYMKKAAPSEQYDVIHFHIMPGANCALLPHYLQRESGAPLLLSVYDWIPNELAFYHGFEASKHRLHWWVSKKRFKYFDGFVVNSSFVERIVAGAGLKNIEMIPNGVDVADTPLSALPLQGSPNILFWGRLYPKKGLEFLLKASADIASSRPEFHLFVGGTGPDEARCKKLCRDLGISSQVTWLGFLGDAELRRYLKSCDFCVLPSIYEGFGISILEAMAAGKPVITSATGGQTDFARDGHNALLVDLNSPGALAQAIDTLIRDTRLRARLGENAAETARHYGWQEIAETYLKLYQRLLGSGA